MLTNLTQQASGGSKLYNAFAKTPDSKETDVPKHITIELLGWAKTDPDSVIGFTVEMDPQYKSQLSLKKDGSAVDVTIDADPKAAGGTTTYTVDLGAGARQSDWSLPFEIKSSGNTGTWVFSKAKV